MGDWISVRLEQPGPDRDAIGSWIEVRTGDRTIQREVTIGGGHASGELGWIHFGLGGADGAEVRVRWPDGEIGTVARVDREPIRDDRTRRDGTAALDPAGLTGRRTR